jgi:hypothetical protein
LNIDIVWVAVALLLGILGLAAGLGFAVVRPRPVHAKKIDTPFVWIENVSPDYLARLPEVPQPSQ